MKKPNILVILNDDMGFSDIGCYGGEVETPRLDALGAKGLKFTHFYNSPRCSPTRASLLTGLHPHQTGIGILTEDQLPDGYPGDLNRSGVTLAELLKPAGYSTYLSGKWHLCHDWHDDKSNWPLQRGFDRFYGLIAGAASYYSPLTLTRDNDSIEKEALDDPDYYLTDAITDNAVDFIKGHFDSSDDSPFFMYLAYTASHWPLHAPERDIKKYKGRFDKGWDKLREERLDRMVQMGIINPEWKLTPRDETQPPWEEVKEKEWQARRMEVYAAQIEVMDRGIGRVVDALEERGELENTLILFLADNGACAEELVPGKAQWLLKAEVATELTKDGKKVTLGNVPGVMPGDESSYQSYGIPWANLSNTPFRLYKHWTHEGGIATPFIAHWPRGIKARGEWRRAPAQLTDIMATVVDITGAPYPKEYEGNSILPMAGKSLRPLFETDDRERGPLFWEHEGNGAVRDGKWKLVKKYPGDWELYDMEADRTELNDLAADHPDRVKAMAAAYDEWAGRCGVIPREKILAIGK